MNAFALHACSHAACMLFVWLSSTSVESVESVESFCKAMAPKAKVKFLKGAGCSKKPAALEKASGSVALEKEPAALEKASGSAALDQDPAALEQPSGSAALEKDIVLENDRVPNPWVSFEVESNPSRSRLWGKQAKGRWKIIYACETKRQLWHRQLCEKLKRDVEKEPKPGVLHSLGKGL